MNQNFYSIVLGAIVDKKTANANVNETIKQLQKEHKIKFDAEIDVKTVKQQVLKYQREFDSLQKSLKSKIDILNKSLSYDGISSSQTKDVVKLRDEINLLSSEYNKLLTLLKSGTPTFGELNKISASASSLQDNFKYVTKQAAVFSGSLSSGLDAQKLQDGIAKVKNELNALGREWGALKSNPELLAQFNELVRLSDEIGTTDGLRKFNSQLSKFKSDVQSAGLATKSFGDTLKDAFSKLVPFLSIGTILSTAFRYIGDAARELKEVNTILTEISKTSDRTKESLDKLGKSAFASASEYGVKATSYLTGVQEMSRAGFNETASEELAKLSILVQAAGDVTMETANDYILATNAAYGYAGSLEKLSAVLDGQNQVTNRNAVAMQDLADATSIAASISAASGVTIQEMTAVLSTMIARTRMSGSEVARAWRAILLNIRQVNTVLEDGEVINSDSMSKYEAAAAKIGVAFKDAEGNLRPAMEILEEMSRKFKELNDNDPVKADFLSSVGSKLRSNQLAALLDGWEDYEKILADYEDSAGSAAKEAEKSANNWQGSLNRLSNSWTSFNQNFINSDTVITLLNLASGFLDAADGATEFTGVLTPLLGILGGVMGGKGVGIASYDTNGKLSWTNVFKDSTNTVGKAQAYFDQFNKLLEKGPEHAIAYAQSLEKTNKAVSDCMIAHTDGSLTVDQLSDAMRKSGKVMDATRLKAIALNAALSFGIGVAINLIIQGLSKLYNYWEDQESKLKELSSEVDEYKDSLKNLYDESGKIEERLKELNKLRESDNWNAKLSEELNTLQNQNTELERQIAYEEQLLKIKQADAQDQAIKVLGGRTEYVSVTGIDWLDKFAGLFSGAKFTKEEHSNILLAQLDNYTKQIQDLNAAYDNGTIDIIKYNEKLESLKQKQNDVALEISSVKEEIQTQMASIYDADIKKPYEELVASIEEAIVKLPEVNTSISSTATSVDLIGKSTTNLQTALDNISDSSDVLREALKAIGENTEDAFDSLESDTFAKLLEAFPDLRDELEAYADGLIDAEELQSELQDALNDFEADSFIDAVNNAKTALENHGEGTNRFEQALQQVNSIIPGSVSLFYDEEGAFLDTGAAALSSADDVLNFMEAQLAAKLAASGFDCSGAIAEYGNLAAAAQAGALAAGAVNSALNGAEFEEVASMLKAIGDIRDSLGKGGGGRSGGGGGKKSILSKEYEQQKELLEHNIKLSELRQERMGEETDTFKYEQKTQYDYYMQLAERIKAEMDRLRAKGYDTTNEEFRSLEQEYQSVLNNIHNLAKDMWEAEKQARIDAIEAQIEAVEDRMDAEKERWEEREKQLDNEIEKYDALIALEEEYADALNSIRSEMRSLDKELETSKSAFGYLDEETRKSLFNEDDYAELYGQLSSIEDEATRLYEEYQKQIDGISKDKTYELEFITNEFQRQYEILLKQYEVSKADLAVAKARRELENVLNERNVAMLVNGVWTWVADPEAVKEAVGAVYDAQAEAEDALTELHNEQRIQLLEAFQDTIEKQKEAEEIAHEKIMDSLEDQIESLEGQIKLIEQTEFNINSFNDVLLQGASSLSSAISSAVSAISSAASSLGSFGGFGGAGDIFEYVEQKKEQQFASGERIRVNEKIDDPNYRMVGSGVKVVNSKKTYYYDYVKYSNGGIIDFTGPAMVHGSPSNPEVVFNSKQAANLYNTIAKTPNLANQMASHVQKLFSEKVGGIIDNTVRNVNNSKINNSSPIYSNCNNTYLGDVKLSQEESFALGQVLSRILPTIRNR